MADKKVFILDDHSIVRHGLKMLIDQAEDLAVCGEAESVAEAEQALTENPPDVLIADITLRDENGLDLIRKLRAEGANYPVLVLSMHDEAAYAEQALRAGANGYVMKEQADTVIISAIGEVLAGRRYMSPKMAERMLNQYLEGPKEDPLEAAVQRLTDRERDVFECMGKGMANQKTAEQLHLSIRTVEVHRAHIKKKLEADDFTQLIQMAVQWVEREKQ